MSFSAHCGTKDKSLDSTDSCSGFQAVGEPITVLSRSTATDEADQRTQQHHDNVVLGQSNLEHTQGVTIQGGCDHTGCGHTGCDHTGCGHTVCDHTGCDHEGCDHTGCDHIGWV